MLGNVSVTIPVDFATGKETGPERTGFSEGGKMIEPKLKTPQNTTVSAIIALERLALGGREFRVKLAAKEVAEDRVLPWQEFYNFLQEDQEGNSRHVLRTMVYENPYAATPLPKDIFIGPYDERWGPLEDKPFIGRTFVGPALAKLEESERQFDLHLGSLQKLMKDGGRKRRQP
jgi:hypothetical protein